MSRITVIGGTGYAGAAIVAEAVRRGHQVTAISRTAPTEPIAGVTYIQGSIMNVDVRARAFDGAYAVVTATAPRGAMADQQLELSEALASRAGASGVRLIVVGGYSSLRPAPGKPRFIEGFVPSQYLQEAKVGHAVLEILMAEPFALDWTFVSPAQTFGAFAPGPATGKYRLGGEVAILDKNGKSYVSAPDFAMAVVDIVDAAGHRREHVSVVG
ncbi:NAD(P)-dependent oxidoreductase [Demequina lutea]|uniref:NAD(P)-binding domain-containing protein n=1 Tax=Demequina lutea TaxID=431489 RepID=A0A7Y9ZBC5_9MICO|nr:NAD(P)H-binding protein [Demequina lutea]NYI40211.1 hypothetical protein [Demequina lutea]